jgi:hypothetical protein
MLNRIFALAVVVSALILPGCAAGFRAGNGDGVSAGAAIGPAPVVYPTAPIVYPQR